MKNSAPKYISDEVRNDPDPQLPERATRAQPRPELQALGLPTSRSLLHQSRDSRTSMAILYYLALPLIR